MINDLFEKYKLVLFVGLMSILLSTILGLSLFLKYQDKKIVKLENELKTCILEKQNEETNNQTLHNVITDLNNQTLKDSIDYEKRLKKFKDEKDEILGINYKNVRSDDCEDIKLILDDIRTNGY
ncbi:hypothetical protein L5F42_02895 [Aliarcobacter butzleri]|uniref:hypothetical protein n=1 Tax=Aliarcobacter butzleri TaxID=28197 RepID=UPI001EE12DCE|nr:hypothetical protein [Aliarcobacter butzleri]MCG3698783.1 hypothetical protein [Aliarcobacter butzleri]